MARVRAEDWAEAVRGSAACHQDGAQSSIARLALHSQFVIVDAAGGCRLRPVLPDPGVGRGGGGDQLGGGEAGAVLGAAAGLRQGAAAAAREGRHVQRGRVRGQVAQHGRGRGQPGHGHVARGTC